MTVLLISLALVAKSSLNLFILNSLRLVLASLKVSSELLYFASSLITLKKSWFVNKV